MDMVFSYVTLIAGLAGILGFLYAVFVGQKTLFEWLLSKKASKKNNDHTKTQTGQEGPPPIKNTKSILASWNAFISKLMGNPPFHKRPWFYIAGWLTILLAMYGWWIFYLGGIRVNLFNIFINFACAFPLLLLLWMAFFAQFILPVRTFSDRRKIFGRLILYLLGAHGPAWFIENGRIRGHSWGRGGPGVLWLDAASAAVTRSAVAIKQTIGPGVHFISKTEYVAGTLDLHIQSQIIGPKEGEKPFEDKRDTQTHEEYAQIQDRRRQVSAWTRDGIEVIPNISIAFRVNTGFPKDGESGSRFGYRTGVTKRDKQNEERDKEIICKVILGEGINPTAVLDSPRRLVAWNELPGALAVDVWREYVAKFTCYQLFRQDQVVPPPSPVIQEPSLVQQPVEDETDPLSELLQVSTNHDNRSDSITRVVHKLNLLMAKRIRALEEKKENAKMQPSVHQTSTIESPAKNEALKKTALQVINDMVRARLTQEEVDVLDDHGVRREGTVPAMEYKLLQERGIEVKGVMINNLRFNDAIEETILSRWSTTWMMNAKVESEQVERKRNLVETTAHEQAIRQYADFLSKDLMRKKPVGIKETLKTLLLRTRMLIMNNPQLRQRMSDEQQDVEEIIRWLGAA